LVGIVELATDTVTRVSYDADAPPLWLPDGSAILITGRSTDQTADVRPLTTPVSPLMPGRGATVGLLERSGTEVEESGFGAGATAVAVAGDGRIAYLRGDGSLNISDGSDEPGSVPVVLRGEPIGAVAFAPGEDAMVVVVLGAEVEEGRIERVELGRNVRDVLANDGWRPWWLP
jgi:hypothetical protein